MDTGENWYISNNSILVDDSEINDISLSLQSSRVIQVTQGGRKYFLYASRVNNALFTGNLVNILPQNNQSISRVASGIRGADINIENRRNAADKINTKSDNNGSFD